MPGDDDPSNLDRLTEQVDELVHSAEQHNNDAQQLAREIDRLHASIAARQQRMQRLEAAVGEWRRRLTVEVVGEEERRVAEERLEKLEEALVATRAVMEDTERRVNRLAGQQQRQ